MQQLLSLSAVALAAFCCAAEAAGYDDFSRGISANNRDDSKSAIAAFSAALAAGDLNHSFLPDAYLGRAHAYLETENCTAALADANAALKLRDDDQNILGLRGRIYLCLDEPKLAEADYSTLIAHSKTGAYRGRALARWQARNWAGAVSDIEQLVKAAPDEVYDVLMLEVMRARAGTLTSSTAREDMSSIQTREWPGPIFDLYLGKIGTADVFSAAAQGEPRKVKGQECEAHFYVAEWMLAHDQAVAAKPLLVAARTDCPHGYFEYSAAKIELDQSR